MLYFLPQKTLGELFAGDKIKRELLTEFGLDGIFSDLKTKDDFQCFELTRAGPGGLPGLIVSAKHTETPRHAGYFPQFQTWHEVKRQGLWLGWNNEAPPTPQRLARKKLRAGYELELADGNRYLIPIARSPAGKETLPSDYEYDDAGQLRVKVKDAYKALWVASAEAWDVYVERKLGAEIPIERGLQLALLALAVNYRVGPAEQSVLHLIDSECCAGILGTLVDLPAAMDYWEQKKTADGQSDSVGNCLAAGSPDESATSDQAEASCASVA